MPSELMYTLIALGASGIAGLWAWFRSRRKGKVEIAAQEQAAEATRQTALGERFEDATDLNKYIEERIEKAIEPLQKQITELKQDSHEIHDAVRVFFTDLWSWDFKGRVGPMPLFPTMLLTKLRLEHLRNDAAEMEGME